MIQEYTAQDDYELLDRNLKQKKIWEFLVKKGIVSKNDINNFIKLAKFFNDFRDKYKHDPDEKIVYSNASILFENIKESFMSDIHYMNVEEADKDSDGKQDYLDPFLGYAENEGLDNEKQAEAIFYRVQGSVAKKQGKDKDSLGGEDMGILWSEYKDAIKDAIGSKKESITTTKCYILEGVSICKDAVIEVIV